MVDIFMRPTARNTAAPPSRRKPGSRAIAVAVAVAVAVVVAFPLSARTNSGAVPGPEGRRTWMCAVFRPSQDGESENPSDDETIGLLCRGSAFLLVTFLWQDKEKLPAASVAEAFAFAPRGKHQQEQRPWIPAYAGMTTAGMTVAGMTIAGMTVRVS